MEDLDALLADLESTTISIKKNAEAGGHGNQQSSSSNSSSHRSSSSLSPQHAPPSSRGSSSIKEASSREMTPPPLPPHPQENIYESYGDDSQPIYETTNIRRLQKPSQIGEDPSPRESTLSHNLTELDSLLQDLSSAQFLAEVDRRSSGATYEELHVVPGGTPHTSSMMPPVMAHHRLHNGGMATHAGGDARESERPLNAASSATQELDDLLDSLADMKVQPLPNTVEDPPYAKPMKSPRLPSDSSIKPADVTTNQGAKQEGNQLETMLGTLQSDLNRQGISTVPKGHCNACAKPIVGEVITALGKMWHPEHFVCTHCHEELGTRNFFEREGQPYCEMDYHQLFSPKCAHCNGPILDKCVTALDKTWHPEHFVCYVCNRPFGDDGFHTRDGNAYCKDDYFERFAPKCGGCKRPIMDSYISALNCQWHPACFACQECGVTFGTGSFFDHEGLPYCETHYHAKRGSLCAGCMKPITGRCITAMYKKFHPEHFVCAFCLKQLNKGTFKENNEKPYCHPCYVKLFG